MSLKILVTSDFHAKEDLKDAAIEEANSGDYDLFINLGDYMGFDYADNLFDSIEIPAIGTTGNRDTMEKDKFEESDIPVYKFLEANIDDDYLVILIGGSFPDDIKEQVTEIIEDHGNPDKVIIGSHYPPKNLQDTIHSGRHIGFDQFREIILKNKPALWMSGHVHEDYGRNSLFNTEVINAASEESGKGYAVELSDEGGVENIEEIVLVEDQ